MNGNAILLEEKNDGNNQSNQERKQIFIIFFNLNHFVSH
jgi:hypothetical protein